MCEIHVHIEISFVKCEMRICVQKWQIQSIFCSVHVLYWDWLPPNCDHDVATFHRLVPNASACQKVAGMFKCCKHEAFQVSEDIFQLSKWFQTSHQTTVHSSPVIAPTLDICMAYPFRIKARSGTHHAHRSWFCNFWLVCRQICCSVRYQLTYSSSSSGYSTNSSASSSSPPPMQTSAFFLISSYSLFAWRTSGGIFGSPVGILVLYNAANFRFKASLVQCNSGNWHSCSRSTACHCIPPTGRILSMVSKRAWTSCEEKPGPRFGGIVERWSESTICNGLLLCKQETREFGCTKCVIAFLVCFHT